MQDGIKKVFILILYWVIKEKEPLKLKEVHTGKSYQLTSKKQSHFQILKINSKVTYYTFIRIETFGMYACVLCLHLHYALLVLFFFAFLLIFFCHIMHVSLLCLCVKGGQHWWGNAFSGSLPLYYFIVNILFCYIKKVKVAHTRLPSVGYRSWSRFLAASLQVTWFINLAVGCHYFPPGLQLPSQPLRGLLIISLLGEQRHDWCEQFA